MFRWFKKKSRILIFGTGAGGMSFFKTNRGQYRIVGFLDNNSQKQGSLLFGKMIYSPGQLDQLAFDKIIIVSDYYREIHQQLTKALTIPEDKIGIFQGAGQQAPSLWERLQTKVTAYAHERICRQPGLLSDTLYWAFFTSKASAVSRMQINWLDQADASRVHVFRPAEKAAIQGPRYIGRDNQMASVMLPAVELHHFHQGVVCSVSRTIALPEGRMVVERVATSSLENADYSGAHLLHHGPAFALVRTGQTETLEKGILVTGCNEVNYYHWMLEILPQLQFIDELPERYADHPILMSAYSEKIASIKAMIGQLQIKRRIILLDNIKSYRVDDLLVISAPNNFLANTRHTARRLARDGYARLESLKYLRGKAAGLTEGIDRSALPRRVFLARKGVLRHYNQDEIGALLHTHGFTNVYMEEHSLGEQVAIMANAEVIVGPTGAAWTNILFASAGAKALCWMADEWGDLSCFSNLAALVGVDMDYIGYPAGTEDSRELYYKQYQIDGQRIAYWLNQLPTGKDNHT